MRNKRHPRLLPQAGSIRLRVCSPAQCAWLAFIAAAALSARGADLAISIAAAYPPSQEVTLSWSATPGNYYELWTTGDLAQAWETPTATPSSWTATADRISLAFNRTDAQRYFRVSETPSPYAPSWSTTTALRSLRFTNNPAATASQNGARLQTALASLIAGDRLEIESGTYSFDSYTALDLQGTADAPLWVTAAPNATVVITRPDASQNIINVGAGREAHYVCFRGLEFAGGSHGVRLYACAEVWIDQCRIHDTGDVGLSANARDTRRLFITRNEIWNTGGTGEGMYLGGNNGSVIMSESVIAQNHVHDTVNGVSQGDGIEVKQGSWGNWIVENHIHDCNYPCLLVYGTAGRPPNIVERNVCYRSNDNTLQVQGECLVRNNLVLSGGGSAFASQPHQGNPTELTVTHNTFVNAGGAARLSSWGLGTNMVFANNACYSQSGAALNVVNGFGSATFAGNVCRGMVTSGVEGYSNGTGLNDFLEVSWDAALRDARPSATSALRGAAAGGYAADDDLAGQPRTPPHTAGCYQAAP